jgi:hypothetical protein
MENNSIEKKNELPEIEKVRSQINREWKEYETYTDKVSTVCRQLAYAEGGILWIVFNINSNRCIFLVFLFLILYFIFDVIQYYIGMRNYYKLAQEHQKKYERDGEKLKVADIEKPSSTNRTEKQCLYVKLILIGIASVLFIGLLINVFLC